MALLTHATGTGKTTTAIFDAKRLGGRTLFIAHRDNLVRQAKREFNKLWPEHHCGLFIGSRKERDSPIVAASLQSLSQCLEGCYGNPEAKTPGLDGLAAEGVLFERAYAQGVVCTPSRKSLLTGLSPKVTGAGSNNYMKEHPGTMTLSRWFRQHGYQAIGIGKVEHTMDFVDPQGWDIREQGEGGDNRGKIRNFLKASPDAPMQFSVEDELGFYLQPECGSWSGFEPGSPTEQFIYEEAMRILAAYGNHPSFVMLSQGNEPWGQDKEKVLFRWVDHFKKQNPRRLYAAKTGVDPWAGDPSDLKK